MNKLIPLFALSLAFACGAADDDSVDNANEAEIHEFEAAPLDELGSAEQALSASQTQNVGLGFNTGNGNSCNRTSASQVCRVPAPSDRNVGYCFSGAWSSNEKQSIRNGVIRVDNGTNWAFTETSAPCELTFTSGVSVGSGSTSTNLSAYRTFSPTGTITSLTETLPGSFSSFTLGLCNVDTADALANGNQVAILSQVGGNCAGHMEGMGNRTDSFPGAGAGSVMDSSVTPYNQHLGILPGEACRASSWNFNGSTTVLSAAANCQTAD